MSATNRVRNLLPSLPVYFAATFCLLSSASVGSSAVGAQQIDGTVSGHVYRADTGEPFAGAFVTLNPCFIAGVVWFLRTTTGVDGSYTVSGRPFCYTATASAPGFVPETFGWDIHSWPTPLNLNSGEKIENVDLHLTVAGVISGSVLYGSEPVANIRVSAMRKEYQDGVESHPQTTQFVMTDEKGNFRLDALPEGDYFVCVDAAHESDGTTGPVSGWTYRRTCYPNAPSIEKAQPVHATTGKETAGIRFQMTADKTFRIFAEVRPAAGAAGRLYLVTLSPDGLSTYQVQGNIVTIPQIFPGAYTVTIAVKDDANHELGLGSQTLQVVDSDVHITVPISKPDAPVVR